MSATDDADDPRAYGPDSFIHLDVTSAYSRLASPNSPLEYVTALTRQFPLNERTPVDQPRPAIALADYGLQSAVKMAVACARAGVEHLCGLRVRLVPEASWHPWAEQPCELLLLAGDVEAWLALVALHNRGHLNGADFRGPRLDLQDLEELCGGELICLTGPPLVGVLAPTLERCADPSNPVEAFALTRRLSELFPDRLYLEISYHGHPREKVVNRALMALSNRFDLPLVATNAVQYARRQDAQAAAVLQAMRANRRTEDSTGVPAGGFGERELPIVSSASTVVKAQAYLRAPAEMHRLFAQVPQALAATVEIRDRLHFRLPLASDQPPEERYGPAWLFGLGPALDSDDQRLSQVVTRTLAERFDAEGRSTPSAEVTARANGEVDDLCRAGLAELMLTAYDLAQFCQQHAIPLAARGSATSSLVAWCLGLVELCPLDYDLDGQVFVHDGRGDLPDLDLEISSLHEPIVSAYLARYGVERLSSTTPSPTGLPALGTLRLGIHVSLGARQAVRSVGAALGLDPIALNSLARQVPLLSSPGAIEQVMTRAPELGGGLAATFEPGQTILRIAAQLEGLPQRAGAHPSAYAVSFLGPGALSWLPAQWVSADRPGTSRFGGPRHLAVAGLEQSDADTLAHPSAPAPNLVGADETGDDEDDTVEINDILRTAAGIPGGPVLVSGFDKADFEALGVPRLDISTSTAMATFGSARLSERLSDELKQGAWQLLAAGDTRCISQVETPGMQALLRRVRDASEGSPRPALASLEDMAQLLALWRPGAFGKDREQAYLTARFGTQRLALIHPGLAPILVPTHGELLYADQVIQILSIFGFTHAWADRYRRALATGRRAERYSMERELKDAARLRRWTDEQLNAILALLQEHAGYLYAHGHALALAQHVFQQACLKLDPATAPIFFAEVLNNGGSAHYGLGAAVEEARQWGVLLLPPCINRSADRYTVVDPDALELLTAAGASSISGAIRVPLTAIRGLGAETVRHILQMRAVFGPFTSLLDFVRRMEPQQISRRELQVLIRLGAFSFTGRSRAQLALIEQIYASAGELLRSTDRDPATVVPLEDELPDLLGAHTTVVEWPPERVAADELAHLGYFVVPNDVQQNALRIAEEFSTLDIAALAGQQHNTVVSIAGVITTLRIRQTKKGEQMAWLTLTDGTGAIECAIFPNAFARLGEPTALLREGAFLVASGKLAHEETTGTKLWINSVTRLGGSGARQEALRAALEYRQADPAA